MDKEIEKIFIENFAVKRIKDRLLFELNSKKYRRKAIVSFDTPRAVIKESVIKKVSNKITEEEICCEIKKFFDIKKVVYIMADDPWDGTKCEFETALETVMNGLGVAIIVCDSKTAFIKGEVGYGAPYKYILHVD